MANQWGQNADELAISNNVAGLDLTKKPASCQQLDSSEERDDAANLADIFTVESKQDIEIQDPSSPLYSYKTFEDLHLKKKLLKGVYDMGFNAPSKIQGAALSVLLADPPQNMIAQSQSGTGKTAAFVLAMLSRVDTTKNFTQVLCLSPTYELAIQIGEVATKMAKFCPEIKVNYAVSGEMVPKGTLITDHILIGTPGKMLSWGVDLKFFDLKKIKVFVLDEADMMMHRQSILNQCIRIHEYLPSTCQMIHFSGTYDSNDMKFAETIVSNPIIIRPKEEEESLDNIKQYYVKCKSSGDKYRAICKIFGVKTIGQAIIFCHSIKTINWLSEQMSKHGYSVAMLSRELIIEQRKAVLDRFRAGLERVLITSNVLSRGIDVEQVTLVVNYDMPIDLGGNIDYNTYLHRIGRAGRFGKAGVAVNLIDSPQAMDICLEIEAYFGKKIKLLDI